MSIERALKAHSQSICLAIGVGFSAILTLHLTLVSMIPNTDGAGYASRAFALYGYLHTSQWTNFWHLLTRPSQSILPLHDLVFFVLPPSIAGTTSYLALQNLVTYLLLAYATYLMTRALNRPAWAPPILLLFCVNNIALTDSYAFFFDMPFFALGLFTLALQVIAWRKKLFRFSLFFGLGLGLLFWLKPANALLFLATTILSEMIYAVCTLHPGRASRIRQRSLHHLIRHWKFVILGFIPLFCSALACGGTQTILQLIDDNEIHDFATPLACEGLLRFFYVPLCFSAFYHILLLGGLLLGMAMLSKWIQQTKTPEVLRLFPLHLFIPIAVSYLIFSEFFSFVIPVKPMRSLLLVLPCLWIAFCWVWEKRRIRIEFLLLASLIYTSVAYAQKTFDVFGVNSLFAEDNYQLTATSWTQMPAAWHPQSRLNQALYDSIYRNLPPTGIICTNSIGVRNSLSWQLENNDFLHGKIPHYEVRNLFDYKGVYYAKSLVGSNEVVLITFLPLASSRRLWLKSMSVLNYANSTWGAQDGFVRIETMPSIGGTPIGYQIYFKHPLTQAEVDQANTSPPFANADNSEGEQGNSLYGRHYSSSESWLLLKTWFKKRFD